MSALIEAHAAYEAAVEHVPAARTAATMSALHLIALASLSVAPGATHVLIESSDQGGRYMCGPNSIEKDGVDVVDEVTVQDLNESWDLDSAASWLDWDDDTWQQFSDESHPYTNHRGGYEALDIRRILAAVNPLTPCVATVSIPGYLPMDDDPPTFETTAEAWEYLAGERERAEDEDETTTSYSDTYKTLSAMADGKAGYGSVVGPTPGYDGDHDLGLVYAVREIEEES